MPTTTGLTLTFSKCGLRNKEADWNSWYDNVHLPDMMASGAYWTISRWEVPPGNMPANPRVGFTHVEVGETQQADLEAAAKRAGARARELRATGRIHPYHCVDDVLTFKPQGRWSKKAEPSAGTKWLYFIFNLTNDPSKLDQWNQWLDDFHLPECMEASKFHSVTRWVRTQPDHHRPNYLVIYEIHDEDYQPGMQKIIEANRGWEASGHVPPYHAGMLMFFARPTGKYSPVGIRT